MTKTIQWLSHLKTVTNETTGNTRYYIKADNMPWRRYSKEDYLSREADSNRADTFRTEIKGNLTHQYKTVYGVHTMRG